MHIHFSFLHSLAPLAPCNSLAPFLCLLVLSSSLPILLEIPGDHHVVETDKGASYLVEYEQEGGNGKEKTGRDHYKPLQKGGEAKAKAEDVNDDEEEEDNDEVVTKREGYSNMIPKIIKSIEGEDEAEKKEREEKDGEVKDKIKEEDEEEDEEGEDYLEDAEKGNVLSVHLETGPDSQPQEKAEVKVKEEEKKSDGEERDEKKVETKGEVLGVVQDTYLQEKKENGKRLGSAKKNVYFSPKEEEDDEDENEYEEKAMDSNEDYVEALSEPLAKAGSIEQEAEDEKGKEGGRKNVIHEILVTSDPKTELATDEQHTYKQQEIKVRNI